MERRRRNNGLTMTAFHSQQSDCARRSRKNSNASTFNFTSQIPPSNLHGHFHEARKIVCNNLSSAVQAHVMELPLYAKQALPLVSTRFLRLANSSPKIVRSPARRSRDGREPAGKKSGEMSRVMSAQLPGNGRTVAAAMPPDGRRDDSQLGRATACKQFVEFRRQLLTMTSKKL